MVPLKVSGITDQSGDLNPAVRKMTAQTASPRTGTTPRREGNLRFTITLAASAAIRMAATMKTRAGSIFNPVGAFLRIGECRCCCSDAGTAKMSIATTAALWDRTTQ
jgi:hypothetical protein